MLPADFANAATGAARLRDLGLPGQRAFPGGGTDLRGPHFGFSFDASAVAERLTARQAQALGLPGAATAAPGHQLVIAQAGAHPGREVQSGSGTFPGDGTPEQIAVSVDGRATPVRISTVTAYSGLLVVSVPTGVHPLLRVTDAGRAQSLDLRTGRRGADAVPGYYPVRTGSSDAGKQNGAWVRLSGPGAAGLTGDGRLAWLSTDGVDFSLMPFYPGRSWARPGRLWLVLKADMSYSRPSAGTDADTVRAAPGSFTLAGADGSRLPLSGAAVEIMKSDVGVSEGQTGSGEYLAEVPAAARTATFTFRFAGSISTAKGATSWSTVSGGAARMPLTLR